MNDAQQLAVTTRTPNVLVSAGAGSGKTKVLTERYLHLLSEDGLTPDQILTLTFTRKAAQEMRERIARALDAQGNTTERRALTRAPIGTIHGFCERILRDHALQADIDPYFRVLDDAEARTLQENALDTVFEDLWSGTQQEREEIGRLLLDFSQRELRAALLEVFRTARTHGITVTSIAPMPAGNPVREGNRLIQAVRELLTVEGGGKWPEARVLLEEALQQLCAACAAKWDADTFPWEHFLAAKSLNLAPREGPKTAKPLKDAIKEIKTQWEGACLEYAARPYLLAFRILLSRIDEAYRAAKREQSLLDFEDILLLTRDLLVKDDGDAGAAEYYRKQFRQVMVDEFQDTNALQFQIINALCGRGHLFTVGDVKQAIYRFIGSDVHVFLQQELRIGNLGNDGLRIPMDTNYRTRPEILGPLNALFAQLWEGDSRAEGFLFEPLAAGQSFISKDRPSVEMAFFPGDEGNAAELRDREAEWITRRILQLTGQLDEPAMLLTEKREQQDDPVTGRPARFGDIMLLFRASTDIPRYEDALRRAGVPFYVVSGRGFYQTREVQDLAHLLRVLENPLDDFSLAVVLRSPLVGISDDTLYWMTRDWGQWQPEQPYPTETNSPKYGHLWAALERLADGLPIAPDDLQALRQFRELVDVLQEEMSAGHPLDLIDSILARTGYAASLLAADDGDQRYANVQKLREVAATFQSRGIFDLADFQRYLTQLGEVAPREPSAPLDVESSNVVRLMTIHASKGLEAPIVFLTDCGREPNAVRGKFLLMNHQLTCQVPKPDETDYLKPASFQCAVDSITAEDRWEGERLLYVALTRAREHLICSGYTKFSATSWVSYADHLAGLLGVDGPVMEDADVPLDFGADRFLVRVWSPSSLAAVESLPPPEQAPTLMEAHREAIRSGEALPVRTSAEMVGTFAQVIDHLQPFSTTHRHGILRLGVLKILCYDKCPRQYWFRYILHRERSTPDAVLPAMRDEGSVPVIEDEVARVDGTKFGTLLHGVMQQLAEDRWNVESIPAAIAACETAAEEIISTDTRIQLDACVRRFVALPMVNALRLADPIHAELPFIMQEHGVLISGKIDLLARCGGAWWILDYKTGKPQPAEHLRQLSLYALGVQHTTGISPEEVIVAYVDVDGPSALRREPVTRMLLEDAQQRIRQAQEGITRDDYHPQPGRTCRFCDYAGECPEGSLQRQEMQSG
ncbi:MAG: UvrD-helicase domain-containing protein [Armatimonadota bacterium]